MVRYGFFAATIGRQFFPDSSEVDSLIAAFGVFAAGYLMRPIGRLVFGYIGDTYGRKATLVLSTAAMAIPTFAIGLLPTAAQPARIRGDRGRVSGHGARDHRRDAARRRSRHLFLGYNLCMALFGGTTPLVTVYLIKVTHTDLAPAYYLTTAAAVSLAVVLGRKEAEEPPPP